MARIRHACVPNPGHKLRRCKTLAALGYEPVRMTGIVALIARVSDRHPAATAFSASVTDMADLGGNTLGSMLVTGGPKMSVSRMISAEVSAR